MPASAPPRRRIGRIGAAAAVGALLVLAAVVYVERDLIAGRLAEDWLARHRTPAQVAVERISLTGLSARVTLGDPSHPALSVERMDVGYALAWPWDPGGLGVKTRSVRLVRPRLDLALTTKGVDLAPLRPLIDWAKKLPPGPLPDIDIQDGQALFAGPAGRMQVSGSAMVRGGALANAAGTLAQFRLDLAGVQASGAGGDFTAGGSGGRLDARFTLGPVSLAAGGARASATGLSLSAALPAPGSDGTLSGAVRARLRAQSLSGADGAAAGGLAAFAAELGGELAEGRSGATFHGRGSASVTDGRLTQGQTRANGATALLSLANLSLSSSREGLAASAVGTLTLAAHLAGPDGAADVHSAGMRLSAAFAAPRNDKPTLQAAIAGGLAGSGATDPQASKRLLAGLAAEPDVAAAAARALAGFTFAAPALRLDADGRGPRLLLAAPIRIASRSGGVLTLSPGPGGLTMDASGASGAAVMALAGGGLPTLSVTADRMAASPAGVRAHIAAEAAADLAQLRGARLALAGTLDGGGGRLAFTLDACANGSVQSAGPPGQQATDISLTLCPAPSPLATVGPDGWTAAARFRDGGGASTAAGAKLTGAAGTIEARGDAKGAASGDLILDRASLADAQSPARFAPLVFSGRADLAHGVVQGRFAAARATGGPLAEISLHETLDSGAGQARFSATGLSFSPGGLQPADLSPLAAGVTGVRGEVRFEGKFDWRPGAAATSGGELSADSLSLSTPMGAASGVSAHVVFTSLAPPVTAPGQDLSIDRIDAVTPVTHLAVHFDLDAARLAVENATADFAHGRVSLDPMTAPLSPGAEVHGVLRLQHVDMGEIVAASGFAKSVELDAVVDGAVPFEAGPKGLSIHGGHLAAVRPGTLSIDREALGGTQAGAGGGQPQIAQDLAYQALEHLAFDQLDAKIDTRPGDRLGVVFHIRGRHAPPKPAKATIGIADLLRGKALAKPLILPSGTQVNLTLDTSLNFGELVRQFEQEWQAMLHPGGSAAVQAGSASVSP